MGIVECNGKNDMTFDLNQELKSEKNHDREKTSKDFGTSTQSISNKTSSPFSVTKQTSTANENYIQMKSKYNNYSIEVRDTMEKQSKNIFLNNLETPATKTTTLDKYSNKTNKNDLRTSYNKIVPDKLPENIFHLQLNDIKINDFDELKKQSLTKIKDFRDSMDIQHERCNSSIPVTTNKRNIHIEENREIAIDVNITEDNILNKGKKHRIFENLEIDSRISIQDYFIPTQKTEDEKAKITKNVCDLKQIKIAQHNEDGSNKKNGKIYLNIKEKNIKNGKQICERKDNILLGEDKGNSNFIEVKDFKMTKNLRGNIFKSSKNNKENQDNKLKNASPNKANNQTNKKEEKNNQNSNKKQSDLEKKTNESNNNLSTNFNIDTLNTNNNNIKNSKTNYNPTLSKLLNSLNSSCNSNGATGKNINYSNQNANKRNEEKNFTKLKKTGIKRPEDENNYINNDETEKSDINTSHEDSKCNKLKKRLKGNNKDLININELSENSDTSRSNINLDLNNYNSLDNIKTKLSKSHRDYPIDLARHLKINLPAYRKNTKCESPKSVDSSCLKINTSNKTNTQYSLLNDSKFLSKEYLKLKPINQNGKVYHEKRFASYAKNEYSKKSSNNDLFNISGGAGDSFNFREKMNKLDEVNEYYKKKYNYNQGEDDNMNGKYLYDQNSYKPKNIRNSYYIKNNFDPYDETHNLPDHITLKLASGDTQIASSLYKGNESGCYSLGFGGMGGLGESEILLDGHIYKVRQNENKQVLLKRYFQVTKYVFRYYASLLKCVNNPSNPLLRFDIRSIENIEVIPPYLVDSDDVFIKYAFIVRIKDNDDCIMLALEDEEQGMDIVALLNFLRTFYVNYY